MNGSMDFSPLSSSPSVTTDVAALLTPREQFTMTKGGIIVTTVTGTLSAVCSVLLLNVIRMSNQKLSTTYHRIMVLMSIFDIMASLFMALTTLPMPSDDELRFDGPMLGNKVTCQMQGYFVQLGINGGASLYMCLIWYFVCRMTFQMPSGSVAKIIEPIFILYSVASGLFGASFTLSKDLLNSAPRTNYCAFGAGHSGCDYTYNEEIFVCDPEEFENWKLFVDISKYQLSFNVIMTLIAVLIILWTIFRNRNVNAKSRQVVTEDDSDLDSNHERLQSSSDDGEQEQEEEQAQDHDEFDLAERHHSRVLIIQSLMYFFAYIITYGGLMIPFIITLGPSGRDALLVVKTIFLPMQGFWNLLIFLYDKAYLVRHSGPVKKSLCEAIKSILLYPPDALEITLPAYLMNEHTRNSTSASHEQEAFPGADQDEDRMDTMVIENKLFDENGKNIDSYGLVRRAAERVNVTTTTPNNVLNSTSNLSIDSPGGFVSYSVESGYSSFIPHTSNDSRAE